MGEDFGNALERRRTDKGLSREGLAKRIGYTYQYVWEQENGRKPPTRRFAEACDRVLDAGGALVALVPRKDDVKRRTMLGVGALATLETIRHGLTRSAAGADADRVDLDEWEAIAWEYGHTYLITPAGELIRQLSADFLAVQSLIDSSKEDTRAGYCRVASQLAVITARTWSSLADYRQAWRWWRTARVTADASKDLPARMMCRGEEVVMGLYERRPIPVLLSLAEEAAAIGGDSPTRGTVGLWAGIAQANAMLGRATEAEDALRQLNALSEALPAETTRAASTIYGWPEYRLRHTESYVHTHLGNTAEGYAAQDRALAMYPKVSDSVGRTQVELHRARSLVLDGDIRDGVDHAQRVIEGVSEGFRRDGLILSVAETVLDAVPEAEDGRADVRAFAEVVGQR